MASSSLIFITGGVRSGKSSLAERLALELASQSGGPLYYIATGVPSDSEMQERIEKHQSDREAGTYQWKTIEQSVQIGMLDETFSSGDIILLDCVTTLLNNELFSTEQTWNDSFLETVKEKIITGIISIKNRAGTMIVVSNEVLNESLLGNDLVFLYGRLLGQIHQVLVEEADQAFLVEAGIPIVMKGVRQ
ncbi:bifunctional adenosylcobinamide kinase/adenosylcobinamide-phosphate guanylyltransferase [Neobacillus sp.]|uniref:bifunctional adenosylcobinamide kinase/adenosylcobinamide-phosphate guanylyltransferase n=1 Tax=Neobacillus sp. TaxID=2675273 RepID=UPI00289CF2C5|nr:bifunctional adenosylcobinamide kinase/adenosylcobinamide-phosphate guanylyltransferase [Neobacillus sp.]